MRKARKIQLTIKADSGANGYLPNWGIYDGIRELIQNAKDAEKEFNAPMTVEWYAGNTGRETLRISNEGCNLDREALLFGHTSKLNREDLIGQYGEGLKIGMLVLVRAGLKVKIFTGNDSDFSGEVWTPTIEKSDIFNANVLTVNIKDATYRKRVRVEVEGLSKEEWDNMKDRFLFLSLNENLGDVIKTTRGEILKSPQYKGRIFVKGIWVETRDTEYGYNFYDAELDRDRKMLDWYSFDSNRGRIIDEAVSKGTLSSKKVFEMLQTGSKDVSGWGFHSYLSNIHEQMKQEFIDKYGEDAIPLESNEQVSMLGHLTSSKGVVVPEALRKVLEKSFGDFETIKKNLENEVDTIYALDELESEEKNNYIWAVGMINLGLESMDLPKLGLYSAHVCSFKSDKLLGQHEGNQVRLSRHILNDRNLALSVLIHEVAHDNGGDGEKSHVSSIEKIWTNIFSVLTKDISIN